MATLSPSPIPSMREGPRQSWEFVGHDEMWTATYNPDSDVVVVCIQRLDLEVGPVATIRSMAPEELAQLKFEDKRLARWFTKIHEELRIQGGHAVAT